MAFGTRPAGTTTRANPKVEYLPQAATNIPRGSVCFVNDAGFIQEAATGTGSDNRTKFVSVQALDNSGGAAGDLAIGVVGPGQFVTVETTTTLVPGDRVIVSTTVDGKVERYVPATSVAAELVGTFLRKEGGTIAKDVSTPFTEEFTDDGDYSPGTAAINDIVEIRID